LNVAVGEIREVVAEDVVVVRAEAVHRHACQAVCNPVDVVALHQVVATAEGVIPPHLVVAAVQIVDVPQLPHHHAEPANPNPLVGEIIWAICKLDFNSIKIY
jgi:hypothetical protein